MRIIFIFFDLKDMNKLNHNLNDSLNIKQLFTFFDDICSKSPSDSNVSLDIEKSKSGYLARLKISSANLMLDSGTIEEGSFPLIIVAIRKSFNDSLKSWKREYSKKN